jgi:uncharacterized protein YdaU (DUF1376 family)
MGDKVRYVRFHPDEYIAGVGAQMDAETQGVYWMICSLIYSHGGPIDNDPKYIGRLVCMGQARARKVIDGLIESGKIFVFQSKLTQKRAETEVKHAQNRTEKAKENGGKGGRPPKKNKDLGKPDGLKPENLTTNHKPVTSIIDTNVSISDTPKGSTNGPRQLSEDWRHNGKSYEVGEGEGYTRDEVDWIATDFADHWRSNGKRKKDWDRTFYNWLRSDITRRNLREKRQGLARGNNQGGGGFAEIAARTIAGMGGEQ